MKYYTHPRNTEDVYKLDGLRLYMYIDDRWLLWYDWTTIDSQGLLGLVSSGEQLCKRGGFIPISESDVLLKLL